MAKSTTGTKAKIGEILKRQREAMDISQRQIGEKLGYHNINFISMLEKGASKIPLGRIPEVVDAYKMPPLFMAVILRQVYPDCWSLLMTMRSSLADDLKASNEELEQSIDDAYDALLTDFRIA